MSHDEHFGPDAGTVEALENIAVGLARTAGEYIRAAYERELDVDFKAPSPGRAPNSNPVSTIDRRVEEIIRLRLSDLYPGHAIVGEESAPRSGAAPITWVIDPIDGTTNFINGLPLFACSIGVLFKGRPLVGAIWCATTHAFRPGTYHAHAGGQLRFEGHILYRRPSGAWRGLACEPGRAPAYGASWDTRVLGCAAVECAFVAAGLARIAYIPRPKIWDVAAGLVLLQAAGCVAVVRRASRWDTMLYLPQAAADIVGWSESLLIGHHVEIERAMRDVE